MDFNWFDNYIWVRIQHLCVSLYFFEHLLLVCNCVILSPFLLCFIFPINKLNIAMKYSGSALCCFACLLGFTCYLQRYTIKYWHIYITGPSNEYNRSDTETRPGKCHLYIIVICFSTDVTGGYCKMRTHTHYHYSGSQCLVLKLPLNGPFFF